MYQRIMDIQMVNKERYGNWRNSGKSGDLKGKREWEWDGISKRLARMRRRKNRGH
jgi:hypothetical protein